MAKSRFLIFQNNIVSSNRNLESVELLLDELDFLFDVIGISETKVANSIGTTPIRVFLATSFPGSFPWLGGGREKALASFGHVST